MKNSKNFSCVSELNGTKMFFLLFLWNCIMYFRKAILGFINVFSYWGIKLLNRAASDKSAVIKSDTKLHECLR